MKSILRNSVVSVLLMAVGASSLAAEDEGTARSAHFQEVKMLLDVWLDAKKDYEGWPSVAVSIVKGQETLYAEAFGVANRETGLPATPDTLYSICSISKLFTSVGVMQLRDQGKLALKDPVAKHLDWYDIEQAHADSAAVTVEGILSHSSGLMREVDVPYWTGPDFPFPSRDSIRAVTEGQETLYAARRHFQYSNLGLSLAGEIVTSLSGEAFGDYIQSHILAPLGMTDTHPAIPADLYGDKLAIGYSSMGRDRTRTRVNLFDAKGIGPAAGFASSVNDLAKFAAWQFGLLTDEGDAVLDHNTLREMHRPNWVMANWKSARGLGFGVYRHDDTTYVGHGGSCPGYRSVLRLDTKKELAFAVMINAGGVNPAAVGYSVLALLAPTFDVDDGAVTGSSDVSLEDFRGHYSNQPWGDQSYVTPWKGGLAILSLGSSNPIEDITKLKHIEGDTFRRIRDDDSEAEPITFMRDEDGRVVSIYWHSNYSPRVKMN